MKTLKVRNKHAMLELLQSGVKFEKISIVNDLDQDNLTKKIIFTAKNKGIRIESNPITKMAKGRGGQHREVLIGFLIPENLWSLNDLFAQLHEKNQTPFFLLINRINFESNIGVIARTAFAAGVNGLFFQGNEDKFLNEETLHFSLGAIARIPLVKMNIFEALKELQRNNIKTFCLQMRGNIYYHEDLSGAVAFVLGAEDKGISDEILHRCDQTISIPMSQSIDSLNVGVSAGIVLFEKIRQDNMATL